MESETIGLKVEEAGEVHYPSEELTGSKDFDPSTVLVQVLRRPSDPINQRLASCISQWVAAGVAVQNITDAFGGWIDVARNWQSRLFLEAKRFRYTLIVDNDVGPSPNTPILLARHDAPLVTACVMAYTEQKHFFLCFAVKGKDGRARFPTLRHTKNIPARGLCEIHNCGAGCVMIRRDVIEELWQRHEDSKKERALAYDALTEMLEKDVRGEPTLLDPARRSALFSLLKRSSYEEDLSGAPFTIPESVREKAAEVGNMPRGEDICFTDRVRAAGFKMYVDFEVHCTHDKTMGLIWPPDCTKPELAVEDWRLSAFDPNVEG